ncbi:MAG: hypothetical protein RBR87_07455, partial [Bacteroidales bacterium]|nr:hypothetical protein [Bacteroidales bacterium]
MLQIDTNDIINGNYLRIAIGLLLLFIGVALKKLNITSFLFKPRIWWRTLLVFLFMVMVLIFWERLFDNSIGIVLFVSMAIATIWLICTIWFPAFYEQLLLWFLFRKKLDKAKASRIKISQIRLF